MNKKFSEGLHVKELIDVLGRLLEKNKSKEDLEVYIKTDKGLSSLANEISTLKNGGIVIESGAFDE